jgi:hypothetical protein
VASGDEDIPEALVSKADGAKFGNIFELPLMLLLQRAGLDSIAGNGGGSAGGFEFSSPVSALWAVGVLGKVRDVAIAIPVLGTDDLPLTVASAAMAAEDFWRAFIRFRR